MLHFSCFRTDMRLRSPNFLLVCLLALTTLWLSETAASHIHLDTDNVSCEICHSTNSGNATLNSIPSELRLAPLATVPALIDNAAIPTSTVAHCNSRAPPSLS